MHVAAGGNTYRCRPAILLGVAMGSLPAPLLHRLDFTIGYSTHDGALKGLREEYYTVALGPCCRFGRVNLKLYKPV